jgi:hypothetical protein
MNTSIPHTGDECLPWPFFINSRAGYPQAKLEGRFRLVHRFVCEKVNGEPPTTGHQAAHACGRRDCVNPRHIFWKTRRENEADKVIHGTNLAGERNPNAKLTADEVTAIRVLRGRLSTSKIAEIFGIKPDYVYVVQQRHSWKHV